MDRADLEFLSQYKWHAVRGGNTFYASTYVEADGKKGQISMHRLLLAAPKGKVVDHIDGNGLNNTRVNIRLCSHAENIRNQRLKNDARKVSRFKGVHRNMVGRWEAEIQRDSERLSIGVFDTEERAARAYDAAARLFFGKFARTNVDLGLLPPKEVKGGLIKKGARPLKAIGIEPRMPKRATA